VAHRGVYADLGGYPADHEGNQTTVTERHSQGRTFESRHRYGHGGITTIDPRHLARGVTGNNTKSDSRHQQR
jgi:hypothetical protein